MTDRVFLDTKKAYESVNRSFENNDNISEKNKQAVFRFIRYYQAKGRSTNRLKKLMSNLNTILCKLSPQGFNLETADMDILMTVVTNIEGSKYSTATKSDFKGILKQIYKFFEIEKERERCKQEGKKFIEITVDYPDKVRFFTTHIVRSKKKLPEDLISREELQRLLKACKNSRDKCILQVMYESGLRIGEFGELKIKHIKFDKDGVVLTAPMGKTGGRRIRIIESERYLRNWLEDHPDGENPEQYFWTKIEQTKCVTCGLGEMQHTKKQDTKEKPEDTKEEKQDTKREACKRYTPSVERMQYDNIRFMFKHKAKHAGINPAKCYPHNFRHSRATELSKILTEAQMCIYFGWIMGSDMPRTYVHLSGRDVDGAILKANGLDGGREERKEPIKCFSCFKVNPHHAKYCCRCGKPLSIDAVMEIEEVTNKQDKVMLKFIKLIKEKPEMFKALEEALSA